jgi:predicted PurR-regulated permease PerM
MAIVLTAWSIFVVGLSDNVVKIALLSRGTELPSLLAFLGALGGLLTWGIVGLFLGPVVIAVCYRITTIWLNEGTGKAEEEV